MELPGDGGHTKRRHSSLENQHFPAQGVDDHEGCLEGGPQSAVRREVGGEHGGQVVEEGVNHTSAVLQIDQQVVRLGHEGLLYFRDDLRWDVTVVSNLLDQSLEISQPYEKILPCCILATECQIDEKWLQIAFRARNTIWCIS